MVLPAQPPMRILMPFRSSTVLISLRNQPPICVPVLPASRAFAVVLGGKFIDQLLALALVKPGILLARIEAERMGAEQRPSRVLADVVVHRGVTHLDGAVLHRVERLQGGTISPPANV